MIKKILLFTFPCSLFANEETLRLSKTGLFFMTISWIAIIVWTITCFALLISKENKSNES